MELKKIENTDIYEFKSTNRFTKEDAKVLRQSFEELRDKGQKIKLLGVVDQLPLPADFSSINDIYHLKSYAMRVVEKYVILSDNESLNKWVSLANFLTPSIPMKMFLKTEREDAIDWLKQDNVKEYDPEEYLSNIDVKQLNSTAYKINISHVKINQSAMKGLYNLIDKKSKNQKLNIMVIFESFPSFDSIKVLLQGMMIDFKSIGSVDKYAVVSDAKWVSTFTKIGNAVEPGINLQFFEMAEMDKAEKWIVEE